MKAKFKLTDETITVFGKTLFRIEALISFNGINKGDKGGFVEKETNLSQENNAWVSGNARVYGDAWVSGDALVYGDAVLTAKNAYTLGKFVGGDDSDTPKFTNITDKTGSDYWKNQYVIGNYEITPIDEEVTEEPKTIIIGNKTFEVTDELTKALADLKEL